MKLHEINRIINEEIQKFLQEGVNHEEIRDIVDISSRMLTLLEKFEETATKPMQDAVGQELEHLRKHLEKFISNPQAYLSRSKEIVVRKQAKTHDLVIREPSGKVVKKKTKKENMVK
jgi:hypothetical protein